MLSCLCLFAHSDVQPVLCSVFVLFGKVSCMHCVSASSGLSITHSVFSGVYLK